eukprot:6914575-Pyramimonas_sp.AAC.1
MATAHAALISVANQLGMLFGSIAARATAVPFAGSCVCTAFSRARPAECGVGDKCPSSDWFPPREYPSVPPPIGSRP